MRNAPTTVRCRAPLTALTAPILFACHGGATKARPVDALPSASSRVDSFSVDMPALGMRQRTIRVYLPPEYATGRASYPVLYLQDAQNLFSSGPFGDWQVDETLDRLVSAGRSDGLIVVGVDNSEHRWDEYSPWTNSHMHHWISPEWAKAAAGGQGAAYLEFLISTLKPEIDRRYRTRPDRAQTGIGGSSMGGLISLYAGLTRPDVFSKVMAMSTAVWFAEGGSPWLSSNRLLADITQRTLPRNVRFYIDVGTNERSRDTDPDVVDAQGERLTYPRAYVDGTHAVVDALLRGGVPPSNIRHVVDQNAIHHESAWARRFGDAVLWLFREPNS